MENHLLTEKIIGCAFKVHKALGFGFLERVYENALAIELRKIENLLVHQQFPIPVYYYGERVGEYFADLLVENTILVEIKSTHQIAKEHEAQIVNYLTATKLDHGLLINFGASVMVRHKYRLYSAKKTL